MGSNPFNNILLYYEALIDFSHFENYLCVSNLIYTYSTRAFCMSLYSVTFVINGSSYFMKMIFTLHVLVTFPRMYSPITHSVWDTISSNCNLSLVLGKGTLNSTLYVPNIVQCVLLQDENNMLF